MIIKCDNCNKNFDLDSGLIPEKGRLLQCNACDHKWFFKKEIGEKPFPAVKIEALAREPETFNEDVESLEVETPKTIELLDRVTEDVPVKEEISFQNNNEIDETARNDNELNIKTSTDKKSYNILGLTIVFIISFIAIIIVLDTFQKPISIFIPKIELILYNLYETMYDIILFFKDLI